MVILWWEKHEEATTLQLFFENIFFWKKEGFQTFGKNIPKIKN